MADQISDILTGLAQQLAADLVGTWNPSGSTVADSVTPVIALHTAPPAPDRVITLVGYLNTSMPGLTDSLLTVNIMCRGTTDPNVALGMENAVYLSLQGRHGALPNGALISQMWLQSAARIGPDNNRRHQRSANYYLQFNRTAPGAQ